MAQNENAAENWRELTIEEILEQVCVCARARVHGVLFLQCSTGFQFEYTNSR